MASASANSTSGQVNLIDKLVTKFNLSRADVQQVFDEDRAAHEADRQVEMKARLDQAVKDGKLTQDQEDKLIAKQQEMKAYMETLKDKTEDERRTAMKAKMDEFKQWITDNNIPSEYGMFGRGHGGHRGPDMGPPPSGTTSQSTN